MDATVPQQTFDTAYDEGWAGWVIGQPQPVVAELEQQGWFRGSVLDAGCGTGDNTVLLAGRGHDVLGIDFSDRAVDLARRNAETHGVSVRFESADALALDGAERFDTVVDSALFHVFGADDRARYADVLHRVCRPGARVFVLALALTDEPSFGPRISDAAIRDAFTDGWELEDLSASRYRAVAWGDHAAELGVADDTAVDLPAWLARIRRV
ncbi:class I SAM-dependent methyltransferase [Saccharomonospora iraqiensis]|uniref:class I SAM-dependent methyltransferase n=1 Tax=Saccharomonospora iraqiensis TaxID=52698 RepID=UPI00022E82A9|nr:class I SAM-dependent methyltransferase [Saccharomonospora iraqiensis]